MHEDAQGIALAAHGDDRGLAGDGPAEIVDHHVRAGLPGHVSVLQRRSLGCVVAMRADDEDVAAAQLVAGGDAYVLPVAPAAVGEGVDEQQVLRPAHEDVELLLTEHHGAHRARVRRGKAAQALPLAPLVRFRVVAHVHHGIVRAHGNAVDAGRCESDARRRALQRFGADWHPAGPVAGVGVSHVGVHQRLRSGDEHGDIVVAVVLEEHRAGRALAGTAQIDRFGGRAAGCACGKDHRGSEKLLEHCE